VESRAEYITPEKIWEAKRILGPGVRFQVSMGLESSSEFIRNICINKGLTRGDYLKAVDCLKNLDTGVTTHILFKPPFLTEAEAIEDAIASIHYAEEKEADRIVLMVSNIKDHTLTSWLAERRLYRVPWLWGVLKTALEISRKAQRKLLIYGFKCGITLMDRGRNCPLCTDTILNKIDLFNFTGNTKHLEEGFSHSCKCKETWMEVLSHTDDFTSLPIPERVEKVCELLRKDVLIYGKALEN
jgi:radical SAM enzyme (TIGR01210 family)